MPASPSSPSPSNPAAMGNVIGLLSRIFFPSSPTNEDERSESAVSVSGTLDTLDDVDGVEDDDGTLAATTRGTSTPQLAAVDSSAAQMMNHRYESGTVTPSRSPRTSVSSPSLNGQVLSAAARRLQVLSESANVSMSMDEEDVRWDEDIPAPGPSGRLTTRYFWGEEEVDFSRTTSIVLGTDEEGEDSL